MKDISSHHKYTNMFIFQTNDKSVTIEVSRRRSFVHLAPSPVASEVSLFGIPCRAGVLASTAIEEWTTVWSYVVCMCDGNHRFLILTYKNSLCIQTLQFSMMCHICFLLVLFLFFLESYDTFNLNINILKLNSILIISHGMLSDIVLLSSFLGSTRLFGEPARDACCFSSSVC